MMATQIKEHALEDVDEIWGSEAPHMPKIYAGTLDLVGTYKGNLYNGFQNKLINPKKTNG